MTIMNKYEINAYPPHTCMHQSTQAYYLTHFESLPGKHIINWDSGREGLKICKSHQS